MFLPVSLIINASVLEAFAQCEGGGGAQTGIKWHHLQWWNVTGPVSNTPDGSSSLQLGVVSSGPPNSSPRGDVHSSATTTTTGITRAVFTDFALSTASPTSNMPPVTLYPVPYFFPPGGPIGSYLGQEHAKNMAIGILGT